MNTLTSVVLLSLLVVNVEPSDPIIVKVDWGKNLTLEGPKETPVEWWGGRNIQQLCIGNQTKHKELRHTCNIQNITLLSVNTNFNGDYFGFKNDNSGMKHYKVTVIPPKPTTRKPLPPPHYVNATMGQNLTLVGPANIPVTWLSEFGTLCEGKKILHKELNHTCNEQNLTLLFVNMTHNGPYFGFGKDNVDREQYEVSIISLFKVGAGQKKIDKGQRTEDKTKFNSGDLGRKQPRPKKKDIVDEVQVKSGNNQTLIGPPGKNVDWTKLSSGSDAVVTLCKGDTWIKHSCNGPNVTLINVTKPYEGSYYGSSDDGSSHYKVTVYDLYKANKTKSKVKPYTTKGTTVNATDGNGLKNALQQENDGQTENDQESKIPSATVAIVVGVIAGFITIIIVILGYICCRKRPRAYNNMVDPLLSFSY
ncbi:E3 CR1-beta [Human mastadenovirus D]|uniref:E3 CR1-beta n=1 Tax=Human mastadenovirus D TaxID=130310 RepID=T1UHT0_9ADEN|nr:E3 CR1-beta [Human mastadenovirus D]